MTTIVASTKPVTVRVGAKVQQYDTLRTAVLHHNLLRDKSGKGASTWPVWMVECEGETYHISYNGRVWVGTPSGWTQATEVVGLEGIN